MINFSNFFFREYAFYIGINNARTCNYQFVIFYNAQTFCVLKTRVCIPSLAYQENSQIT